MTIEWLTICMYTYMYTYVSCVQSGLKRSCRSWKKILIKTKGYFVVLLMTSIPSRIVELLDSRLVDLEGLSYFIHPPSFFFVFYLFIYFFSSINSRLLSETFFSCSDTGWLVIHGLVFLVPFLLLFCSFSVYATVQKRTLSSLSSLFTRNQNNTAIFIWSGCLYARLVFL